MVIDEANDSSQPLTNITSIITNFIINIDVINRKSFLSDTIDGYDLPPKFWHTLVQ